MAQASYTSFGHYASRVRDDVNAALDLYSQLAEGCPDRLRKAIRYSLLSPGKRLRPLLVILGAEACGGKLSTAMPAACAVEMVHAYSLIHDDLPAMDDDDLRRGRPTCHKAFDEPTAILAGDALLTLAFEVIAKEIKPSEVAAACCSSLAGAAGACSMVGGQADDILSEGIVGGIEMLDSIHRRKTGAMILVSLQLGAMTANANRAQLQSLQQYGSRLGLAFQITDDLLDVRGSEADVGKRVGKDSQHGKLTFPGLLGVDESVKRAEQLIDEACGALAIFEEKSGDLESLARYVLERNR